MTENQNIKLHGIPASQKAARDLRAQKRKEQSPKSATEYLREKAGNILHQGMQNFAENARGSPTNRPLGQNIREGILELDAQQRRAGGQPPARKGKGRGRERERDLDLGPEPMFNPEMLNIGGGGLDFSMHPDPMYQNLGGGRKRSHERDREEKGGRLVKVVTRTYRED